MDGLDTKNLNVRKRKKLIHQIKCVTEAYVNKVSHAAIYNDENVYSSRADMLMTK